MWVQRPGVEKAKVANAFRVYLLYRENLDLGYIFGSLEATGIWPAAGDALFKAAKQLHSDSLHHLHGKLQVWNITDDLEDLDTFRPSQILCTADQLRGSTEKDQSGDDPWDLDFNTPGTAVQQSEEKVEEAREEVPDPDSQSCTPVVTLPTV